MEALVYTSFYSILDKTLSRSKMYNFCFYFISMYY